MITLMEEGATMLETFHVAMMVCLALWGLFTFILMVGAIINLLENVDVAESRALLLGQVLMVMLAFLIFGVVATS